LSCTRPFWAVAAATRPVGAAGSVTIDVVAEAIFEYPDSPDPFTRYQYVTPAARPVSV
jgi:hypothetical protein